MFVSLPTPAYWGSRQNEDWRAVTARWSVSARCWADCRGKRCCKPWQVKNYQDLAGRGCRVGVQTGNSRRLADVSVTGRLQSDRRGVGVTGFGIKKTRHG